MAYGAYTFNTVQIGRETTAGTAVPATEKWRGGFAMLKDTQQRETVEEQVGQFINSDRVYTAWKGAELQIPATAMTFEQLPHILEAGILTATPSGAGPYVYDYVYPISTAPAIKTYTLEAGNVTISGDNQEMPYSFVSSAKFSGNIKQPWQMESSWMGQQLVASTLTPALSLLTVEEAIFGNTALTIDASGGTIGTTAITGVLMSAEINISDTGIREVPTADGTNYFSAHKHTKPEITFSMTMELEDGEDAVQNARSAYNSNTPQLIQMTISGSGTSEVRFRFAGRYTEFGDYTNDNGNTNVQISGTASYNSTDAIFFECQVTNGRASL